MLYPTCTHHAWEGTMANDDKQSLAASTSLVDLCGGCSVHNCQHSQVKLYRYKRNGSLSCANAGTDRHPTHSKRWTGQTRAVHNASRPLALLIVSFTSISSFFLTRGCLPIISAIESYSLPPTTPCLTPTFIVACPHAALPLLLAATKSLNIV